MASERTPADDGIRPRDTRAPLGHAVSESAATGPAARSLGASSPQSRDAGTSGGDMLGYLVKHVHRRLSAAADAALEPLGIDRREFGVLHALTTGALSQQGVATKVSIDPTTMVALIDGLAARGILTRTPDATDRRRNSIQLTALGRSTYRRAKAANAAAEDAFLAPLGAAGAARFRTMLQALLGADASPDATAATASAPAGAAGTEPAGR